MTYILFIIITGGIGIIAAALFALKVEWPLGRVLLPLLSILFFAVACTEYLASFNGDLPTKLFWLRFSLTLHFIIGCILLELTVSFLGKEGIGKKLTVGNIHIPLRLFWRPAAGFTVAAVWLLPWFSLVREPNDITIVLNRYGEVLFSVLFIFHLLILYIVEKIFRNISTVQKRVFALYLISTGLIALGSMVLIVRILFFRMVAFEIVQIHAVLCSFFFPGMLIGLTRYRLWKEDIEIGRGMVYTSITILFFGLFLIALGVIASAVRLLGIKFNDFEQFVLLFTFLFISVLTFFSPNMRKTITGLSRKYIYKSKYDYRDQLLRLHAAHQTTGGITKTISAFIDNLRFTIIVKNAFIFLRSTKENRFHRFNENGSPPEKNLDSLRANSPLVRIFEDATVTAIATDDILNDVVKSAVIAERSLVTELSVSHIFSITHNTMLVGLLLIDAGKRQFDSEDLMLITMFCESVGTAIYRDRIQRERIEQKQFESFSHMASFIVHDIKNQVATLSLVTKNARSNISNPQFHPVLLRSMENCSENLSTLIAKLQSPPRREQLVAEQCECNEIINGSVEPLLGSLPTGITIATRLADIPSVNADSTALSYILKNLIINAVEAIGNGEGTITCSTGNLAVFDSDDTFNFGFTTDDYTSHSVFILVEDNGPGMSREFLDYKLFQPFNTTKDKGIGIGLYQCKTLVESMGGKIYCWSEVGKGTRFCLLF